MSQKRVLRSRFWLGRCSKWHWCFNAHNSSVLLLVRLWVKLMRFLSPKHPLRGTSPHPLWELCLLFWKVFSQHRSTSHRSSSSHKPLGTAQAKIMDHFPQPVFTCFPPFSQGGSALSHHDQLSSLPILVSFPIASSTLPCLLSNLWSQNQHIYLIQWDDFLVQTQGGEKKAHPSKCLPPSLYVATPHILMSQVKKLRFSLESNLWFL